MWASYKHSRAFTIVELLIVVVVIGILAAITITAYTGSQAKARDAKRAATLSQLSKALDRYYLDKGGYPAIEHGLGSETSCGSQTENWGHCDRLKVLTDALAPYIQIDPTSLSSATQGNYYYSYASQGDDTRQSYGLMVYLEGTGGANDNGYFANALEVGTNPEYCKRTYTGGNADWLNKPAGYNRRCQGGN